MPARSDVPIHSCRNGRFCDFFQTVQCHIGNHRRNHSMNAKDNLMLSEAAHTAHGKHADVGTGRNIPGIQ